MSEKSLAYIMPREIGIINIDESLIFLIAKMMAAN